jgi:hypothetical protein
MPGQEEPQHEAGREDRHARWHRGIVLDRLRGSREPAVIAGGWGAWYIVVVYP